MKAVNFVPGAVVFLTALYFMGAMIPAQDAADGFHFQKFGQLPIVDGGRIKPVDTFARTNLMLVSEQQGFKEFNEWQDFVDRKTKSATALKWLLDTMAFSEPVEFVLGEKERDRMPVAFNHRILRIENDQVLNFLKLEPRPGFYRYSMAELQPRFTALIEEAERVRDIDPKSHNLYEAKIAHLEHRLGIIFGLTRGTTPLIVPPRAGGDDWKSLRESLSLAVQNKGSANPFLRNWIRMLMAYREGKVDEFNKEVDEYSNAVASIIPADSSHMGLETFVNNFNPFFHCAVAYGLMFALACLSWIVWPTVLNRAVFWTLVLVVVVHTWALIARMVIQGRPPVTNLYSTAIFVGWTGVLTCMVVERFHRNSLALAVGSLIGLCTGIIAHYWSLSGDTLEMMQAVLDTNFWLATHVTTVNYGYSATIVAGFMGLAYILLGLFTPVLAKGTATSLSKATYGVICFAMFLSFVGTVLGGIWADQSWGRFWGWDPKENGALLIVIWNALILHSRWAGLVKQRGIAVLAVAGNIITAWSWVGTNQLGVGLHAYGSTNGVLTVMLTFDAFMVGIMLLGLIPLRHWKSFQPSVPKTPNTPKPAVAETSQSVPV